MSQKRKNVNNEVTLKKKKSFNLWRKEGIVFASSRKSIINSRRNRKKFWYKKNTVCDILKNKEKWLNVELNSSNMAKQKEKSPKFPELEEALAIWISNALSANKTIMGEIIITKATDFAKLMNIEDFTGSSGWLNNF